MVLIYKVLLMGMLSLSALSHAQFMQSQVQIGFGAAVKTSEVGQLLHRNTVTPKAAYMWAFGLNVTYRSYDDTDADEFMENVKLNAVKLFENGLEAHQVRLKKFLETVSEEELMASPKLQSQARSLLNHEQQFKNALKVAKSDHPMIYALEVVGYADEIEEIKDDAMVKGFLEINGKMDKKSKLALKPSSFRNEYRDPLISTLDSKSLYSLVRESVLSE